MTETDIENSLLAADFNIKGFQTALQNSTDKVRTLLLVRDGLKMVNTTKSTKLPSSSVQIQIEGNKTLKISSIYRQWSTEDAKGELNDIKEIISEKHDKNLIVMGDFNIDAGKFWDSSYRHHTLAQQLLGICDEFGLKIREGGATFSHPNGKSTLDYFLTSSDVCGQVKILPFGNSDHDSALLTIPYDIKKTNYKKVVSFRSVIKDETAFKEDMKREMTNAVKKMVLSNDIDQQSEIFKEAFNLVLNMHAPKRTKTITTNKPGHSLSAETLSARKERNKVRNAMMKASPDEKKVKMEAFRRIRNRVNSLIKRDRALNSELALQNGINPFRVANSLLGKNQTKDEKIQLKEGEQRVEKEEEVASIINEFFIQKVKDLKKKIDPNLKERPTHRLKGIKSSFKFQFVSVDHVQQIIRKMKTSASTGMDGISSKILKLVTEEVSPSVSLLVNTSFSTGTFPKAFKVAKVIPIFKNKGKREDKSNYRPVSNLSTIGKVIEIAANIQITRFGELTGILGNHQHGFRRGRSTTSALVSSLIKWQHSKEKRKVTGCLLYDLSAAYDTISSEILVEKIKHYGFDQNACNWVQSFTTGRSQAVSIGQSVSRILSLDCGLPQGSPLSCVLFLVYVGDLPSWVQVGHVQGYADDTIHFVEADTEEEVMKKLENEACNIFCFFASNELVANTSKTAFLMFRPTKNATKHKRIIKIGDSLIEESESERILGLQVHQSLEWNDHINKVISKVNYGLATLKQLQGLMRRKALRMITEGIIMSHIRYGISVYMSGAVRLDSHSTQNQILDKLQKKQNDAMRLILNKKRADMLSREKLLEKCNMKSINQIAASAILMENWRAHRFQIDSITREFSKDHSQRGGVSLRTSKDPASFVSISAKLINAADNNFRSTRSVWSAKKQVNKIVEHLPVF